MSLNHKRRIFRGSATTRRTASSLGFWLAAAGGAATLLFAAFLFLRASDAPARAPASTQIAAGAGQVTVVDGDTLRVGEYVVRLGGIAAPARGSACHGSGQVNFDCGTAAANAAAALLRGHAVACTIRGHDALGRPVGTCLADSVPLADALVRGGWVRADTAEFAAAEAEARAAGRGIWQSGS